MNPTCPSMDDTRNIITAFLAALMDTNHDAANVRQTLREFLATQEAPALSLHERFWVEHRSEIIQAVQDAGYWICSNNERVWLHRAESAPKSDTALRRLSEISREMGEEP